MWKDRSLISLLLAFFLLVLVVSLRPRPAARVVLPFTSDPVRQSGAVGERFWVLKTHGTEKFDMILMGDSRVYRGLSPQAMEAILPDCQILNFGYSGGGLNAVMYAAVEAKLNPSSRHKAIVFGVTPLALTPRAARNEHYLQELGRSSDYIFLRRYWLTLVSSLQAVTAQDWSNPQDDEPMKQGYYQEFYDDGWIASGMVPENPRWTLPSFEDIFRQTPVSQKLVDELMAQTRTWREQGVSVYGFRVPSSSEMVALEDRMSGFVEAEFIRQFEAAGGVWFDIPLAPYHSYDGSHLSKNSALQLSTDLARLILNSRP